MGLIERYRERLPLAPAIPSSRWRRARRRWCGPSGLSERVGAEVRVKVEGANPTGSFKDRGMTCAGREAVRGGAEAVICASTGNTAASRPPTRRARAARRRDRAGGQDRAPASSPRR